MYLNDQRFRPRKEFRKIKISKNLITQRKEEIN